MKAPLLMALPLLVAACSGGGDAEAGDNTGGAVIEATPNNLAEDPGNDMVPLGGAALPEPERVSAMPPAFRGRWGLVPNDCVEGRDDAKGLMTVTGDRLTFYESRAIPSDLALAGTRLTATLSFTGEGRSWTQQGRFVLLDDGRTLTREATGGEGGGEGLLRYSRCPDTTGTPA